MWKGSKVIAHSASHPGPDEWRKLADPSPADHREHQRPSITAGDVVWWSPPRELIPVPAPRCCREATAPSRPSVLASCRPQRLLRRAV